MYIFMCVCYFLIKNVLKVFYNIRRKILDKGIDILEVIIVFIKFFRDWYWDWEIYRNKLIRDGV